MERVSVKSVPTRAAVMRLAHTAENIIGEMSDVSDALTCAVTLKERLRAVEDSISLLRGAIDAAEELLDELKSARGDAQ